MAPCLGGGTAKVKQSNDYLINLFKKYNIEDRLLHMDYLPEEKLIIELNKCDVLLLSNGFSFWTQKRLTTKLFVYLSAKRPIIALCEEGSAIDELIKSTNTGDSISASQTKQIARTIVRWIDIKSNN